MRVGLVVERFEPIAGGVEQAIWNIAHELVRAGDEVHVFARRAVETPGITLHRLRVPAFWQPLRVTRFAQRARCELDRHPCDVVHAFCRVPHADVFHAGGGSHADYMEQTYGRMGTRLRALSPRHRVQLSLERRVFADPKTVIQCVSTMVRDELAGRFDVPLERMPVIPYGIDLERFDAHRNAAAREPLRAEWEAGDGPVWLFAGSGWRRKGLDVALEALARPEAATHRLWVAGKDATGPWKTIAARLGVAERVRFVGVRMDLERLLAASDGLLLPTRYDAFGLVCLEAAAASRPVIVSDRAGASEWVGDGGNVVPFDRGAEGFAAALGELSERRRRERMGEAGREIAMQCSWEAMVARLRELYRKIAS